MGVCSSALTGDEDLATHLPSGIVGVSHDDDPAEFAQSSSSPSPSNVTYKVAHIRPRSDEPPFIDDRPPCTDPDCLHGQADLCTRDYAVEGGGDAGDGVFAMKGEERAPSFAEVCRMSLELLDHSPGSLDARVHSATLSLPSSSPARSLRSLSSASSASSPVSTTVHLTLPISPEQAHSTLASTAASTDSPPMETSHRLSIFATITTHPGAPHGSQAAVHASSSPQCGPCQRASHARNTSLSILQVLREGNHSRSASLVDLDGLTVAAVTTPIAAQTAAGQAVVEFPREGDTWRWKRRTSMTADPDSRVEECDEDDAAAD